MHEIDVPTPSGGTLRSFLPGSARRLGLILRARGCQHVVDTFQKRDRERRKVEKRQKKEADRRERGEIKRLPPSERPPQVKKSTMPDLNSIDTYEKDRS